VKFIKENILYRFGTPHIIISDNRTHFYYRSFETLMRKYLISHKLYIPYHPQICGQVNVSNIRIKQLLEKTIKKSKRFVTKVDKCALGYRTTCKTNLGMSPFRLVYGKVCHLPVELEHKVLWVIKNINIDFEKAGKNRNCNLMNWKR